MLPEPDYATPPADIVGDKKVSAVLSEYARLIAARDAEYASLRRLEDERARAVEADQQAFAAAIRAGKDDPGQEATAKADQAILACRRKAEALAIAASDAVTDLVATVDRQRAAWAAQLDKRTAEGRAELGAAVDALVAAHAKLGETLALRAWLADFPARPRWPVSHLGHVPALRSRSGEPPAFEAVVAGLRELARPPEPKAPPEARPLAAVPEAS